MLSSNSHQSTIDLKLIEILTISPSSPLSASLEKEIPKHTFLSSLSFLLAMNTLAPFCTKACAAISPNPVAPPVTRTTWFEKSKRLDYGFELVGFLCSQVTVEYEFVGREMRENEIEETLI